MRIRLIFNSKEVGERGHRVSFDNLNDSSNSVTVSIHTQVRQAPKEESIIFPQGRLLDFGDCCAGVWTRKSFTVKNVSESPLDLTFAPDGALMFFSINVEMTSFPEQSSSSVLTEASSSSGQKVRERTLSDLPDANEGSNSNSSISSRALSPIHLQKRDSELNRSSLVDVLEVPWSTTSLNNNQTQTNDMSENYTKIDEVQLRPGSEKTIDVWFQPERDVLTSDKRAARLNRRNFRFFVVYNRPDSVDFEKQTIQCRARSCTSFVEIEPSVVDFGDTDVGTTKSMPLKITNISDVPAKVEFRFVSKILSAPLEEINIAANKSAEVRLTIFPRKVNPDYQKQITIANLLNRDNDQQVDVRSSNVDQQMVALHSLFYRVVSAQNSALDFGMVTVNSSSVRSFLIENTSTKPLQLGFSSSANDEIKFFVRSINKELPITEYVRRRDFVLESMSDKRKKKMSESNVGKNLDHTARTRSILEGLNASGDARIKPIEYLDLASSGEKTSPKRISAKINRIPSANLSEAEAKPLITPILSANNSLLSIDGQAEEADLFDTSISNEAQILEALETRQAEPHKLVAILEKYSGALPPLFPKISSEVAFVRLHVLLNRRLQELLDSKELVETDTLRLSSGQCSQVIVILNPGGQFKDNYQV